MAIHEYSQITQLGTIARVWEPQYWPMWVNGGQFLPAVRMRVPAWLDTDARDKQVQEEGVTMMSRHRTLHLICTQSH